MRLVRVVVLLSQSALGVRREYLCFGVARQRWLNEARGEYGDDVELEEHEGYEFHE